MSTHFIKKLGIYNKKDVFLSEKFYVFKNEKTRFLADSYETIHSIITQ